MGTGVGGNALKVFLRGMELMGVGKKGYRPQDIRETKRDQIEILTADFASLSHEARLKRNRRLSIRKKR